MFTYLYLGTNDLDRAITFYDATMGILGHRRCITGDAEWDRIGDSPRVEAAASSIKF
jgi:catechol 2,3-dioxygenase-like lactoylglutathione lyase family enzyme